MIKIYHNDKHKHKMAFVQSLKKFDHKFFNTEECCFVNWLKDFNLVFDSNENKYNSEESNYNNDDEECCFMNWLKDFNLSNENKYNSEESNYIDDDEESNYNSDDEESDCDSEDYDRNGYNLFGYDCNGFDKNGYNLIGYDRNGFDENGYNFSGWASLFEEWFGEN
jgi:hypothetical protein